MDDSTGERPLGVYLVALYFVLAGFLEPISKYQESDQPWSMNPLSEHSLWTLAVDPIICLTLAYLIWRYASMGRLAALVFGYVYLTMYLVLAGGYFLFGTEPNITPLFLALSAYHVLALPALLWYLQPARQKKLFHVSLWDILVSSD